MGLREDVAELRQSQRRFAFRTGTLADLGVAGPTNVNLFRITGGPINLVGLAGRVTTNTIVGAATLIALNLITAATAITAPICAVVAAPLNGHQIDTVYTITGAVAVALTVQTGAARGVGVYKLTNEQVLVPGVIVMTVSGGVATAGAIDWMLSFVPLADNVQVVRL
jgi:nitrogenase subunit NifH